MVMKCEQVGLFGFNYSPKDGGTYQTGGQCGTLEVDTEIPKAILEFSKVTFSKDIVFHPTLGEIPHYKAVIIDMCNKAAELLIKRMEG